MQASQLVLGKSNLIGLVLEDVGNPLFAHLASQINYAMMETGYEMIVTLSSHGLDLLERLKVEGIIYWGDIDPASDFQSLLKKSMTPVLIVGSHALKNVACLCIDRELGIQKAIEYLMSFGHRRIGLIGNSQENKVASYQAVLKKYDLPFEEKYILPSNTTWWGGYSSVLSFMVNDHSPTAFIGINNLVTRGALRAFLERGLTVPTDVSLVGYDDLPDMDQTEVPLTTVGPSLDSLAHVSTSMMIHLIRGHQQSQEQIIEPVMYVRKSVGYCKQR